jgi:hypothetical protein
LKYREIAQRYENMGLDVHDRDQMMAILKDKGHLIVRDKNGIILERVDRAAWAGSDEYIIARGYLPA